MRKGLGCLLATVLVLPVVPVRAQEGRWSPPPLRPGDIEQTLEERTMDLAPAFLLPPTPVTASPNKDVRPENRATVVDVVGSGRQPVLAPRAGPLAPGAVVVEKLQGAVQPQEVPGAAENREEPVPASRIVSAWHKIEWALHPSRRWQSSNPDRQPGFRRSASPLASGSKSLAGLG